MTTCTFPLSNLFKCCNLTSAFYILKVPKMKQVELEKEANNVEKLKPPREKIGNLDKVEATKPEKLKATSNKAEKLKATSNKIKEVT